MSPIQKEPRIGYRGPFLERGGESAIKLVNTLMLPPERPLDSHQIREALQFESSLYRHELEEGVTIEDILRLHASETVVAPLFFARAFIDGAVDMSVIPDDIPQAPPLFKEESEVYEWVARSVGNNDRAVPEGVLLDFSQQSAAYYKKELAKQIVAGGDITDRGIACARSIVLNPEKLLKETEYLYGVRAYLNTLRKTYTEDLERSNLDGAKRAIADIYLAKVNSVIADNIPRLLYLADQAAVTNDHELLTRTSSVLPGIFERSLCSPLKKLRLLRRLDYIRNGIGLDTNNKPTGISALLEDVEQSPSTDSPVRDTEGMFDSEQIARLKKIEVSPSEMVEIFSDVLSEMDLLSSEPGTTCANDRTTRAKDGKWQVIINPDKATFDVQGKTGIFKVPTESRSLYDVLVVGGAHELTHVEQSEIDKKLSETVQLAALRGKRVSIFTEGGAKSRERDAVLELTGSLPRSAPNLTYAKALQVIENGGDVTEAAKAFYDEKLHIYPDTEPMKAAVEAADRVIRLFREGGYSSANMSYAEEWILTNEIASLDEALRSRATQVTSFDLVDQVRLHRYGLLPDMNDKTTIDGLSLTLAVAAKKERFSQALVT